MELTKIRNWSDDELKVQETQASEQLFRIRFQAKLGQNEGVKKLRELRKDIARIKTVAKERTLGIRGAASVATSRLIASLLFNTSLLNPLVLSASVFVLLCIAIAASLVPAVRASRTDPITAIRYE